MQTHCFFLLKRKQETEEKDPSTTAQLLTFGCTNRRLHRHYVQTTCDYYLRKDCIIFCYEIHGILSHMFAVFGVQMVRSNTLSADLVHTRSTQHLLDRQRRRICIDRQRSAYMERQIVAQLESVHLYLDRVVCVHRKTDSSSISF